DFEVKGISNIACNQCLTRIGPHNNLGRTVRQGEFEGLVLVRTGRLEDEIAVRVKSLVQVTQLQTRARRMETAARADEDVKLARSIEHRAAVAEAALPVRSEELPATLFGGRRAVGQFGWRAAGGESLQHFRGEEPVVGSFEVGDFVELILGWFD